MYLKYITDPPAGLYSTVINTTTQDEDYNALTSVDLIWNEQEQPELVKILLYFKGIEVRESAIIQWINKQTQYQNRG